MPEIRLQSDPAKSSHSCVRPTRLLLPAVQCSKWVMFFWLAPKMMFLRRLDKPARSSGINALARDLVVKQVSIGQTALQTYPTRALGKQSQADCSVPYTICIHAQLPLAVNWDYLLPLLESSYSNAVLNFPSHDLGSLPNKLRIDHCFEFSR